jgi:hypothetical protein
MRPYLEKRASGVAQAVRALPSKREALKPNPIVMHTHTHTHTKETTMKYHLTLITGAIMKK